MAAKKDPGRETDRIPEGPSRISRVDAWLKWAFFAVFALVPLVLLFCKLAGCVK